MEDYNSLLEKPLIFSTLLNLSVTSAKIQYISPIIRAFQAKVEQVIIHYIDKSYVMTECGALV